jgi:hypothetical protein
MKAFTVLTIEHNIDSRTQIQTHEEAKIFLEIARMLDNGTFGNHHCDEYTSESGAHCVLTGAELHS